MSRTLLVTLIVLLGGVLAFAHLTHGFSVLTAEAARRQAVIATPVEIPALEGIDQAGRRRRLVDSASDAVLIVDFIYTRCVSICSALGSSFQRLQADIERQHLEGQVRLVTVSFDPAHDTPAVIAEYSNRLRVHPGAWTILTPRDPGQLQQSLEVFGIVATPAGDGQYIHNAAFHLIDRHGRLVRIIDSDQPERALEEARRLYLKASS